MLHIKHSLEKDECHKESHPGFFPGYVFLTSQSFFLLLFYLNVVTLFNFKLNTICALLIKCDLKTNRIKAILSYSCALFVFSRFHSSLFIIWLTKRFSNSIFFKTSCNQYFFCFVLSVLVPFLFLKTYNLLFCFVSVPYNKLTNLQDINLIIHNTNTGLKHAAFKQRLLNYTREYNCNIVWRMIYYGNKLLPTV